MANLATRLWNCAVWHLEHSERTRDERDRARHAELADSLFIQAYITGKR